MTTMANPAPPRLLVLEDDASLREAIVVVLTASGYDVQPVSTGTGIEEVIETFHPDLAILDVRLPVGPDGYAIARRLRAASDVAVVFLTAADSVEARLAGFQAGGDDYLVKPFSMAELLARAAALLRRAGRLSSAARQVGDLVIDEGARTVIRGGEPVKLTRTEYELLSLLAAHPGQVLSKPQLLTHVWGFDAHDPNVVEKQLVGLRRKLEAHGPRIIHTVQGMGYVLRAE